MLRSVAIFLLVAVSGFAFADPATAPFVYTGYPLYAKAITPTDDLALTNHEGTVQDQYVYVGVAGDVTCLPTGNPDAQPVTFVGLAAGSFVPVKCRVVYESTTATSLVGVY